MMYRIPEEVARHWLYYYGDRTNGYRPGSFTAALIECICAADWSNRERLRLGFPEYVAAYEVANTPGGMANLAGTLKPEETP
jgi:hypothetical protein